MDADGQDTDSSPRVSVVRAGLVLVAFVIGVAILVAVGTRPSVSGVPPSATTATVATGATTTTAAGGATTTTAGHTTTTKAGHHGTAASTTSTAPHSTVSVVVANATTTNGLAGHYTTVIGAGGWNMKPPLDASTQEATSAVYYATGQAAAAAEIATMIGVKPQQVLPLTNSTPVNGATGTDVVLVIGQDLSASGS
jgi:LytR cell envelope-related transcriptional attenuator